MLLHWSGVALVKSGNMRSLLCQDDMRNYTKLECFNTEQVRITVNEIRKKDFYGE